MDGGPTDTDASATPGWATASQPSVNKRGPSKQDGVACPCDPGVEMVDRPSKLRDTSRHRWDASTIAMSLAV